MKTRNRKTNPEEDLPTSILQSSTKSSPRIWRTKGLPSRLDRIKIVLIVTALSAQTIILAFVCMTVVWFISTSLGHPFKVATTLLSGIVCFALSSITFWRTAVRFFEQRRGSKRS